MASSVIGSTMVKGRRKRKIEIKKRETKEQRSVAFSKRRQTLFSKAADLCFLTGANIAVFVTSLVDDSDDVYSFSGYSTAFEIADCYLNGKLPPPKSNPQSKLGFWWEDPDLYRSCDDISELKAIADRMQRMKNDLMACLEKKENLQLVSNSDQESPCICSIDDKSCSHIVSFDQNFNLGSSSVDENCGGSSSQFVSDSDQKLINSVEEIYGDASSKVVRYDPNTYSSLEEIYGEFLSDQSCYLVNDDSGELDNGLWETENENSRVSLPQEHTNIRRSVWSESFGEYYK